MKDYKAYLFDMDGTLVNSEPLKGQALALACGDFGGTVDYKIYTNVMGQHWNIVTRYFFEYAGIKPDLDDFNQNFQVHYKKLLHEQLANTPGAKEYLNYLNINSKTCGVVSSAARWTVEYILNSLNIYKCFDFIIAREDVSKHKPDPEPYLLALERLGLKPSQTVIFEDSSAGIQSGISSGCDVIAIRHHFNRKHEFSHSNLVIESFHELLP